MEEILLEILQEAGEEGILSSGIGDTYIKKLKQKYPALNGKLNDHLRNHGSKTLDPFLQRESMQKRIQAEGKR